jgi:serine/threonine protein kinase/Flp pilus assembly protein TadD
MAGYDKNDQKHTLEEALQQFVNAQLHGRALDVEEFVKRYPEHEPQIRKRIRKLYKINNLFDSLVQADESDFEEIVPVLDLVGRKVGSFEITEMIGRGGMGVVYLARDTKLDRSVAIKSIPAKMAGDATARKRFRREAKLLASLNHPNIAVIHEIFEEDKSGYLILEYVPGETLAERMAREPLALDETLSISQQIAEAVLAAHEQGIVHRDLKPSNIKITPNGRVKVLDFGLAKASVIAPKSSEITETQPGRVIGTPAYMSPEQARGKDTDHRTDIWSFGCILYQMLTRRLPFEGETATDTLACIIEREPDWDLLPRNTPANIRTLLQRCLEKEPDRRLGNIADASIEIHTTLIKPATVPTTKLRKIAMILSAPIIITLLAIALRFLPEKPAQPSLKQIRLVVLPFENVGPAEEEYFADGITDEIRARLAVIHNLGVISRQSSMQYKKSEINAQQIAEELGVDYILEGTIQRERTSDPNSRVKITLELIKASNDMHMWAEVYDGYMSEIYSLQSVVAEQVARELDITLLEPQRQALAYKATKNTEAYEYYLKGKEYYSLGYSIAEAQQSIEMYKKAIALDPDFAQAYAGLSRCYSWMYQNDKSDSWIQKAKNAVENAFRLDPDLPEAHHALGGFYYNCHRDYNLALNQYEIVRKSQPNNSEIIAAIGNVQRRQGRFDEAIVNIKDAFELNPLSFSRAYSVGYTLTFMRKYEEADFYFERAIKLAPNAPFPYIWKARNYLRGKGDTARAREVLEGALEKVEPPEKFAIDEWLVNIDLYDERYKEALDALDRLSSVPEDDFAHIGHIPNVLKRALIYDYWDKKELAKEHYELACNILKSKAEKQPREPVYYGTLGIAYAGLGRKDDAIRAGKWAIELDHETPNADGLIWDKNLARIYVMLGEYDKAIDKLDFLLRALPARISGPLLQIDPAWDDLHDHPRFQNLIEQGK